MVVAGPRAERICGPGGPEEARLLSQDGGWFPESTLERLLIDFSSIVGEVHNEILAEEAKNLLPRLGGADNFRPPADQSDRVPVARVAPPPRPNVAGSKG